MVRLATKSTEMPTWVDEHGFKWTYEPNKGHWFRGIHLVFRHKHFNAWVVRCGDSYVYEAGSNVAKFQFFFDAMNAVGEPRS